MLRLRLINSRHSGKIRPHEHTAYLPLALILFVVGIILTAYTARAATPYDGPEARSIGIIGTMPGKPPTVGAVIQVPTNDQHFGISPTSISGTCPENTIVELFKNDIFAGSTACADTETFSLSIDMMIGKNIIKARVYDALNQAGPDSNEMTIYYDALPAQSSPLSSLDLGSQIIINTDTAFRGVFPRKDLSIPIDIIGGTPPFAVNVQFGDSNNKILSRSDNTSFNVTHAYSRAGTYQVTIQVTDAKGNVAFLTVAVIVNGDPNTATGSTSTSTPTSVVEKLLILWPLYVALIAIVISFFIGEKRERHLLEKRGLLMQ